MHVQTVVRGFRVTADLCRHMLTNIREKHYACPECHKRFSFKSIIRNHMLTHKRVKSHACT